jgi:outer membrane autotransporter protein
LGGRAQTTFTLDGGGKIIPSVMLGWQHQFLDTSMTLSESLASSPYAGFFQEKGPDYGRDSALLGVGIEGDIWDRTKLFLDYNVKLNGDYTAHAVSAGLRVDF